MMRSPTRPPATALEITELLGEVDPFTLEQLLATRATIGEVADAVCAISDEDAFGETRHAPATRRAAEVRAILEDFVLPELEDREAEHAHNVLAR